MPTKRIHRSRINAPELSDTAVAYFFDEINLDAEEWKHDWEPYILHYNLQNERIGASAEDLWRRYGAELTEEYAVAHPGTRPSSWWRWSAPEPRREGETQREFL